MFTNASNFNINGGTYNVTNIGRRDRCPGLDLLKDSIAPGAFHNSAERYDAPKCHPRTRLAIIDTIILWVQDRHKTSSIMWVYGPAGGGKSSIAQTIALLVEDLAASFFWSRSSPGRNDETRLIVSLAYQLVIAVPQTGIHVEEAILKDPAVLSRSLEAQMQALVIEPLRKAVLDQEDPLDDFEKPRLIILDGLDECGTPSAQCYILDVISTAITRFPIPLIFLIASRPEQEIRDFFNTQPILSITTRLALDDTYHPNDDIKLFLLESFTALKKSHILRSTLPSSWPSAGAINSLVQKSSGQFIYAATVIKFIKSPRGRPQEQLDIVLRLTEGGKHTPFAELDALYRHIFSRVQDRPRVFEILTFFFLLRLHGRAYQLIEFTAPFTAKFFEDVLLYKHGDFQMILGDLHSVLDVPDIENPSQKLRVFHASLQDFLLDSIRSGEFHMDPGQAHARLTRHVLRFIRQPHRKMHFNIRLGEHCSQSSPTKELLQELFSFDLEKWIFVLVSNDVEPWACFTEIFVLTSWFQEQESTVRNHFEAGNSLYVHHSHSRRVAINFMCETMVRPYHDTELGRYRITAITHPRVLRGIDFSATLNLFLRTSESGMWLHRVDHLDFILYNKFKKDSIAEEQILELRQFLRHGVVERAGYCRVDGGMYTDFSLQLSKVAFEVNGTASAITTAIDCLPFFLSNADYKADLAGYLHTHTSNFLSRNVQLDYTELLRAIDVYLKASNFISRLCSNFGSSTHN